jgi:hypothetical protein
MARNLLLSGGPSHDFASVAAALSGVIADAGIVTTVVDEPAAAIARLRDGEAGRGPRFALMTVHALHWRMEQARYSHLRDSMAWSLSPDDAAVIDRFVRSGGGLLALHTAVICFDADPVWHALCGAAWDWETSSHPPIGKVPVTVTEAGRRHCITAGSADFEVVDEAYRGLRLVDGVTPLARAADDDRVPLLWAREIDAGRVVTDVLGHGVESLDLPAHRAILVRAAAWAARRPPQSDPEGVPS